MDNYSLRDNTELSIITSAQQGRKESFGLLYDKYAPLLIGVIERIVNDEKHSEEILKKSFIIIWKKINTYNPAKENLFIWMMNIARNIAKEETLPTKHINRKAIREDDNSVYSTSEAIPEMIKIKTGDCALNINEKQRAALDLIFLKGYTHKEAAEKLSISLDAFKIIIKQTIKDLKRIATA